MASNLLAMGSTLERLQPNSKRNLIALLADLKLVVCGLLLHMKTALFRVRVRHGTLHERAKCCAHKAKVGSEMPLIAPLLQVEADTNRETPAEQGEQAWQGRPCDVWKAL